MPQVVISDQGTVFVSKFMKDLYDLLQIKANASTAFHPQTDGQTERVNQEVEKYLRIFINHLQDDWVEWLSLAAFAHNNHTHSAMGKSPFEVNYGYNTIVLPGASPRHHSKPLPQQCSFPKCRRYMLQPNDHSRKLWTRRRCNTTRRNSWQSSIK